MWHNPKLHNNFISTIFVCQYLFMYEIMCSMPLEFITKLLYLILSNSMKETETTVSILAVGLVSIHMSSI